MGENLVFLFCFVFLKILTKQMRPLTNELIKFHFWGILQSESIGMIVSGLRTDPSQSCSSQYIRCHPSCGAGDEDRAFFSSQCRIRLNFHRHCFPEICVWRTRFGGGGGGGERLLPRTLRGRRRRSSGHKPLFVRPPGAYLCRISAINRRCSVFAITACL